MKKRLTVLILGLVLTLAVCSAVILFLQSYWTRRIAPTWILGPLVVSEGALFHGEWEGGRIYEWSLDRFELIRALQLPSTDIHLMPTKVHGVERGTIVATGRKVLYGIDYITGDVTWSQDVSPREIIVGTAVYYLSADGAVGAIDTVQGHRLWHAPRTGAQAITISESSLVVISPDSISAFELLNGKELWSFSYDGAMGEHKPLVSATQGIVCVIYEDSSGATVGIGLDANTGEVKWSKAQPYPFTHVLTFAGESGTAFVFLRPGDVVAMEAQSGQQLWRQTLNRHPADIRNAPHIDTDRILLVSGYSLVELDRMSGKVTRRIRLPGTLATGEAVLYMRRYYVYYNERSLYLRKGKIRPCEGLIRP